MKVKLVETKNQRRLHIGMLFVDLNESEFQELQKIFGAGLLVDFKTWYDKLTPVDKVSVWSEDGESKGLFNMSDKRIVEKYINKIKKVK